MACSEAAMVASSHLKTFIFYLFTQQNLTVKGSQEKTVCVEGKIYVMVYSSFRAVVRLHLELVFVHTRMGVRLLNFDTHSCQTSMLLW